MYADVQAKFTQILPQHPSAAKSQSPRLHQNSGHRASRTEPQRCRGTYIALGGVAAAKRVAAAPLCGVGRSFAGVHPIG